MPADVHPQIQAIIDATAEAGIPRIQDLSPAEARQLLENLARARREKVPPPTVFAIEDATTGTEYGRVPVRIYRAEVETPAPVLLYYHGGGHVIGSLDTHDTVTRNLCNTVRCTVISVDYRMGPEHPFPAAVEDAYHAARWVSAHADELGCDGKRLALAGDSAGGNLAAVVSLLARGEQSFSVSAQCLVYPVADYRGGTESYARYAEGYGILEAQTMTWFRDYYLGDDSRANDWRASPLLAESHAGLPPTLILTAACDVLNDEGVAYARARSAAGVEVEHVDYPGMVHGFFGFLGLVDDTERAHQRVADFLSGIWTG